MKFSGENWLRKNVSFYSISIIVDLLISIKTLGNVFQGQIDWGIF
jgi:hypothetical protein